MDLEKPQSRPHHRGQGRYGRLHESDLVRAADAELGQVDLLELDLSLIERILYMCLLYSTLPSALHGKKTQTSNSNIVRRRYVSALRTRKTGLASCWTRLGRSDWPGRNVSAYILHDDPFSSSYHYCPASIHYWQIVVGPNQTGQIRLAGVESVC